MIEYSKTAADSKDRIMDLTWFRGRIFLYMAIGAFVFTVFCLIVGIMGSNYEAIQFGIYGATLVAVLIAMILILYAKFRKAVTANFDNHSLDGRIDFTLEKIDDDTLELTRLTDEESFEIHKKDIKSIRTMKTIHVIWLKDGKTIDLPKKPDIDELIRTF